MLNCGHNGESWSIWSIPGKHPYCAQDTVDRTRDGRYQCYENGNQDCRRLPYIYNPRPGWNSPNQLSRDLGNGSWSQSLVLDTDNCNFLVQLECYEDGSVHTYVTYKSTWPRQERLAYRDKARWVPQLSFLKYYMFDCENGYV
ncbi:uncharacterized protein LOC8026724 [Ixodes scapularis]|uniref:uncharacterized protein LOC8026724 n=1 Tax=Ixodes scapularis TaxID=6945 RepID=UPI001C385A8D|nr:uncharacterized protein LOC8026724 [Ixodes scapularis]XP_042147593.1 uncharacterized protein LOC8026724 [Ixodes scapularis]XP_042147594.1 uncharacterized protein LOC8026724 [Ixodes scapularis]